MVSQSLFASDPELKPLDYQVFSRSDISSRGSDFEARAGAVGDVELRSFLVSPEAQNQADGAALVAGGRVTIDSGSVRGEIEAGGSVNLPDAQVSGKVDEGSSADVKNLPKVSQFFMDVSKCMASLPNSKEVRTDSLGILSFQGGWGLNVYSVSAHDLKSAWKLRFSGSTDAIFIVNVSGDRAEISRKTFVLKGSLQPEQILMNFPETHSLTLNSSGTEEESWGIPATILAPLASVDFSDARLTGGLYVGKLIGDGQVNFVDHYRWTESCSPSLR